MRTYEISKGSQYDADGAVVCWGNRSAQYLSNGKRFAGDLPKLADLPSVEDAVRRVIGTGQAETVTIGEPVQRDIAAEVELDEHQDRMERMMDSGDSAY